MGKNKIEIVVDASLPPGSGRISRKAWERVKAKKGGSAFFPDGSQVFVGDPFGATYIVFVIDNGLADDRFEVSVDVKTDFYASRSHIDV